MIPRLGRPPGKGKGCRLQYSGLESSVDCVVHGVVKRLGDSHSHSPESQRPSSPPQKLCCSSTGSASCARGSALSGFPTRPRRGRGNACPRRGPFSSRSGQRGTRGADPAGPTRLTAELTSGGRASPRKRRHIRHATRLTVFGPSNLTHYESR